MKRVLALWIVVAASGCGGGASINESAPRITQSEPISTQLEHPLLKFDVVPIPTAAVADEIDGDVRVLRKDKGWVPLLTGADIENGSRLQLAIGSRLRIVFASGDRAELTSPDKERWIVFEQVAAR